MAMTISEENHKSKSKKARKEEEVEIGLSYRF